METKILSKEDFDKAWAKVEQAYEGYIIQKVEKGYALDWVEDRIFRRLMGEKDEN